MMSLAEKIAEKKRLAALAATQATGITEDKKTTQELNGLPPAPQAVSTGMEAPTPQQVEDKAAALSQPNKAVAATNSVDHIAQLTIPTHDASGKPLSGFALVKARKEHAAKLEQLKAEQAKNVQIQSPSVSSVTVSPVSPMVEDTAESAVGAEPVMQSLSDAIIEEVENTEEHDALEAAATPETRQAYHDVKERLNALVNISGEDLRGEMALLKKALMQNPNAVELMLPSDIGQMVIALRKMTGVELAAVKEGKTKSTKAKKEMPLTAEQLQNAWEEL